MLRALCPRNLPFMPCQRAVPPAFSPSFNLPAPIVQKVHHV